MPEILHVSSTPNPLARKFHADEAIAGASPLSYPDAASAQETPVAKVLFDLKGVRSVFLLDQVVTVNIDDAEEWETLEPEIKLLLEDYLEPFEGQSSQGSDEDIPFPEDFFAMDLELQVLHIEKILNVKVRPGLAGDGGGIQLMGIDGKTVYVYYLGACGDCPSSTSGTLNFIQQTLKTYAHPELVVELS